MGGWEMIVILFVVVGSVVSFGRVFAFGAFGPAVAVG